MHADTKDYNRAQEPGNRKICALLARTIDAELPEAENKVWHAHPVRWTPTASSAGWPSPATSSGTIRTSSSGAGC